MPLIEPRTNRVKTVRHICRLQEPNRDALVLDGRFIGDTAERLYGDHEIQDGLRVGAKLCRQQ